MTTMAPDLLRDFADEWETLYKSAVCSGIVGDSAHEGGYHVSLEDQSSSNYSAVRPDDKAPPGSWPRNKASAVDMSVSYNDMLEIDKLVHAVFNDKSDPRRNYINAINCWDGNDLPGRYDMYANTLTNSDSSHEWHVHWEFRRKYINDGTAMAAGISILKGETKDQWINAGHPAPPAPKPQLRRPWPKYMPHDEYFGLITGPHESHGGYYSNERSDIKAIQQRMIQLGYVHGVTNPASSWADGIYEKPTKDSVSSWQKKKYSATTTRYGEVWNDDWGHLFTY